MSYDQDYTGIDQTSVGYAPASFGDANETVPTSVMFDIGGNGLTAPYSGAINAIMTKQMDEIRKKSLADVSLPTGWKKRFREFMSKKNNDLLGFLNIALPAHPILGPGELLIRKFGNPQVTPNHASVRDIVVDISGENVYEELNAALLSLNGENHLNNYALHTRALYDLYREAGEAIFTAQASLKVKLDNLDKLQGKISSLFEIDVNEKYEPLLLATEEYLKQIYEKNDIEGEYNTLISAYRRFAMLKDIINMSRTFCSSQNEPMCSICIQDSVAFTFVPCGHTFCQGCMRKQHNECFICRGRIKERVKLYFS
jgi:hypothetical protein